MDHHAGNRDLVAACRVLDTHVDALIFRNGVREVHEDAALRQVGGLASEHPRAIAQADEDAEGGGNAWVLSSVMHSSSVAGTRGTAIDLGRPTRGPGGLHRGKS